MSHPRVPSKGTIRVWIHEHNSGPYQGTIVDYLHQELERWCTQYAVMSGDDSQLHEVVSAYILGTIEAEAALREIAGILVRSS